ncbi:16S rRNA (adenine(1518)-N(6)/adenine(1519)-N(6))-dimethyltransferase RsmA [Chloroflexota bacterium]
MISKSIEPINVPALLKKYGLRPSKGLGQNFLVDKNALHKVVNAAEISSGDLILEVGAGLGSLTQHLSAAAQTVITVELDEKLLPVLHETLVSCNNVKIVVGDILKLNPANLLLSVDPPAINRHHSYKVVANIPYYITSALIRHLLEAEAQPNRMVLTVQKEVGQRICALPPEMSLLALSVQVYGSTRIAAEIPAGAFYPAPKVDSSVVKIEIFPSPLIPNHLLPMCFRLAKAGFSQKRKTLRNAISAGMAWPKDEAEASLKAADIDPQRRAQTLTIKEWERLTTRVTQR